MDRRHAVPPIPDDYVAPEEGVNANLDVAWALVWAAVEEDGNPEQLDKAEARRRAAYMIERFGETK